MTEIVRFPARHAAAIWLFREGAAAGLFSQAKTGGCTAVPYTLRRTRLGSLTTSI